MKKILIWALVLLSVVIMLVRYSAEISEVLFGVKQKSGISILSTPSEAAVFLDGVEAGKTPFEDKNLAVKEYDVKLEKADLLWLGKVKLTSGTVTVINRDLAKDPASQSGEVLTLDKGRGMTIISNPAESEIEIDGKVYGKTPLSVNLDTGEHTILISHPNYLKRSIRANLADKFNLTISVDLSLSEADLTTISSPKTYEAAQVEVLQTPTGFLRVRDKGSLKGLEIARVNVGDKLILLEELSSWDRVRLSDGTEGFVSSAYVKKTSQEPK